MDDGLVDEAWWRARQDDYLVAATAVLEPRSPLNVLDHFERSRRDPSFGFDTAVLTDDVVATWCRRIDHWLDCADFDVLRLLTMWLVHRDRLPEHVTTALRERFLSFRYWYTDPAPNDVVDERWYWSENHRLIFHTCEHLAGQALPDERFERTGMTGAEHRHRANAMLAEWFDDKARYGFSEWHSDAYYAKDLAPLVTLADVSDDVALAERAATFADLVLYDLALHSLRDNCGTTHGRSYMRFKATGPTQTVFSALKLCFDRTEEPWPLDNGDEFELLPATEGAVLLARCQRYRPADVLRRVANYDGELVDSEGMGVALDPSGPVVPDPRRDDGLSYTDPAMVPFWWDRGALTPWQLAPLSVDTLDRHQLWDAVLFAQFRAVRDALGGDRKALEQLAADLHPMLNAGLLERVDTITWRNCHAMLSTAQAYRPGTVGYQHYISQATLDEYAVAFTTHPGNGPSSEAGDYLDHDRFWTGSATLPLAVQHRRVVIQQYSPAFASPEGVDVLAAFAYCDHTHAYVPTERFDEVVQDGHWTMARRRGGYVAIWSWRPTNWREHDPAAVWTGGLTEPFELVAWGGPENVWIIEVGDIDRWDSFDAFRTAITPTTVEVVDHEWGDDGAHRGFDVRYSSPAEGELEVGPHGSLRVSGVEVPAGGHQRFDNAFGQVPEVGGDVLIVDEHGGVLLDLDGGVRRWVSAR